MQLAVVLDAEQIAMGQQDTPGRAGLRISQRSVNEIVAGMPLSTNAVAIRSSKSPGRHQGQGDCQADQRRSASRMRGSTRMSTTLPRRLASMENGGDRQQGPTRQAEAARLNVLQRRDIYGTSEGRDKEVRPGELMVHDVAGIPTKLTFSFDTAPSVERAVQLGDAINAFHGRTMPRDANRFALY